MIRHAEEKDIAGILEIYNEAIVHTTAVYHYFPLTLEEKTEWYRKLISAGFPVLVCEMEGKVAGYASFGVYRDKPGYKYTVENSIFVHPDFRRRGFGQSLMKVLIREAEKMEMAVMVGCIDADNRESILLHEKLGFTFSGVIHRAGFKFGRYLDAAFYQLDLRGPEHPVEG